MKLLTKEIRKKFPLLDATDELGLEAVIQVKFFTPDSNWTWYAVAFDGNDIFYGLVYGVEVEFGTFRLSELETLRGPYGLRVERDRFFKPILLKEIYKD